MKGSRKFRRMLIAVTVLALLAGSAFAEDAGLRSSWRQLPRLRKVAAEEGAMINDLYSVVAADKDRMICEDHIHLTATGIEAVAEQTAGVLREMLKQ